MNTSVMVWSTHTHTQQPTSCEVFRSIGTLQHRDCADGFTCYVGRYDARTNTNCMPGFELWPCVTPCDLRYCKCVQAYSLWWRIHTRLCSCRAFLEGTTLTLLLLSPAMSKRNPGFVKCSSTAGIWQTKTVCVFLSSLSSAPVPQALDNQYTYVCAHFEFPIKCSVTAGTQQTKIVCVLFEFPIKCFSTTGTRQPIYVCVLISSSLSSAQLPQALDMKICYCCFFRSCI